MHSSIFSRCMRIAAALTVSMAALLLPAAGTHEQAAAEPGKRIAVFIPGAISGSPVYEMLANGVKQAAAEYPEADITFIEAGPNQSMWKQRITAITATGNFDVIISSNPSLPFMCADIVKEFPGQHFILLDGHLADNPAIATVQYNQREQGYMAGYMAGLVTVSSMKFAGKEKKIGLIAAQEYPAMNGVILPAYLEGARAVDPDITVDFRIVGNWYDGAKAADLAKAMKKDGVDVIMPICGGANQGVLTAAKENGFYVIWFDSNGYDKTPGYVVGSAVMNQTRMAYEQTKNYLTGKTVFGKAATVGVADGYIDFIDTDPLYLQYVPADIREKQHRMLEDLRSGRLVLPPQN